MYLKCLLHVWSYKNSLKITVRCRKSPKFGIDVGRSIFRINCFIVGWDLVKEGQKPQWYSSIDKVAFRLITNC